MRPADADRALLLTADHVQVELRRVRRICQGSRVLVARDERCDRALSRNLGETCHPVHLHVSASSACVSRRYTQDAIWPRFLPRQEPRRTLARHRRIEHKTWVGSLVTSTPFRFDAASRRRPPEVRHAHVVLDQVSVDRNRGGRPFTRRGDHLRPRVRAVPRLPKRLRRLSSPAVSTRDEAEVVDLEGEGSRRPSRRGRISGRMKRAVRSTVRTRRQAPSP